MGRVLCCIVAVVSFLTLSHATAFIPSTPVIQLTPASLREFLATFGAGAADADVETLPLPDLRRQFIATAHTYLTDLVQRSLSLQEIRDIQADRVQSGRAALIQGGVPMPAHKKAGPIASARYPYFGFLPPYIGPAVLDQPLSFQSPCFNSTTVSLSAVPNSSVDLNLNIDVGQQTTLLCADFYLFATTESLSLQNIASAGIHTVAWKLNAATASSPAVQWDLKTNGVRVFRFVDNDIQTVLDLVDTLGMFMPELTPNVSPDAYSKNLQFMQEYAGVTMTERATVSVDLDESLIQSGDFLGVVRLDGLDPMLAWAMGSSTGHTTVALRMNGTLFITESTTKDSYWPTDGIQKTEYKLWKEQAKHANYSVVWAPLTAAARASFDEDAAIAFFESVQGYEYGYRNLLFGWIDTNHDNYPCLPPDYSQCLQWEHVPIIAGILGTVSPATADMIFLQALNHRVGKKGLSMVEILYEYTAVQGHADASSLPTVVEEDTWLYNTTRNGVVEQGPSMVCCVFVCNVWKHAGILKAATNGNDFNCAELTNWDDYALDVLEKNPDRPAACVAADPSNPLCQIEGLYTLQLTGLATKHPYPHMAETCPSKCPDYKKPANC